MGDGQETSKRRHTCRSRTARTEHRDERRGEVKDDLEVWGSKDGGVIDRNTGVKWGTFENRDDFVMSQNLSNTGWDHLLRISSYFYHNGSS